MTIYKRLIIKIILENILIDGERLSNRRNKILNDLVNKLKDILTKANKESNDQLKKDVLDNLKGNDIDKGVEKLDDVISQKPKRDFLVELKKNKNIADAGDNLEKLLNKKQKENKFI